MCRRNHLFGLALLSFGAGLIIGCWLESGLLRVCLGVGLLAAGILMLQKK